MNLKNLENLDVSFNNYDISIERHVRCIWALYMYRHHVLRENLSDSFIININKINELLGVAVETINLNDYKNNYIESKVLNKCIEENEYPKFVWFMGLEALNDSSFAGWLRNRLTIRLINNLRVIFIAESNDDFKDIFCDIRAPLYQSTMLLQTNIDN
jgi:hypothetical protein